MATKRKRKYKKLRGQTREEASQFIAEERHLKKYKRSQAIAIGISRAISREKQRRDQKTLLSMISKYK